MRKLFAILTAVLIYTGLFAACGEPVADHVARIKTAGELVVATSPDHPPFEYIDGSDIVGVDIDIAQAIADDLGVTLRVVAMDFDSVLVAIASGSCDLGISGLSVRSDRLESMDFSSAYFDSTVKILVSADSGIRSSADLRGKTVAVQTDTLAYSVGEELGAKIVSVKTNAAGVQELKTGRVDALLADKEPAGIIAGSESGWVVMLDEDLAADDIYAVAAPKGCEQLVEYVNNTIQRLIDEGKIDEFITKHKDAK